MRRQATGGKPDVRVRRVYDEPASDDGTRVLGDRIWPRGLTKAKADLAEWCKQVAPSTALRKWYEHDPAKFEQFVSRYRAELDEPERARAAAPARPGGEPSADLAAGCGGVGRCQDDEQAVLTHIANPVTAEGARS